MNESQYTFITGRLTLVSGRLALLSDELILGLEVGQESIDDAILYALTKLKNLYEFNLHATITNTETIEQICVMQLEQKISKSCS